VNLRPNKAFLVTALCRATEINGISISVDFPEDTIKTLERRLVQLLSNNMAVVWHF